MSRDLFRSILDSEEEHVNVIETHLGLVKKGRKIKTGYKVKFSIFCIDT